MEERARANTRGVRADIMHCARDTVAIHHPIVKTMLPCGRALLQQPVFQPVEEHLLSKTHERSVETLFGIGLLRVEAMALEDEAALKAAVAGSTVDFTVIAELRTPRQPAASTEEESEILKPILRITLPCSKALAAKDMPRNHLDLLRRAVAELESADITRHAGLHVANQTMRYLRRLLLPSVVGCWCW